MNLLAILPVCVLLMNLPSLTGPEPRVGSEGGKETERRGDGATEWVLAGNVPPKALAPPPRTADTTVAHVPPRGADSPEAQAPQSGPTAAKTTTYNEYNFGFQIDLPVDWTYDRIRFAGFDAGTGLLQGAHKDGKRSLQILFYRSIDPIPFSAWVDRFQKKAAQIEGTAKLEGKQRELTGRFASVLEADATALGVPMKRFYYCVPFDETAVWVLILAAVGPAGEELEKGRAEFEAACNSLVIKYSPMEQGPLLEAFKRGQALIQSLPRDGSKTAADGEVRFYEIRGGGKPVGYLTVQAGIETHVEGRSGKAGLRLRERVWEFGDDGRASVTRSDAFAAFDGNTELVETQTTFVPPGDRQAALSRVGKGGQDDPAGGRGKKPVGPGGKPAEGNVDENPVLLTLDQCVREGDMIFSSYSTSSRPDKAEARRPIKLGPAYLSQAWVRRLPSLLGTTPGEYHAFLIYDAQIRALVTYMVRSLGEKEMPGGGKAFAYESKQGFASESAMTYADRDGMLIKYAAGDTIIALKSEGEIDGMFAGQRKALEKRVGAGGIQKSGK